MKKFLSKNYYNIYLFVIGAIFITPFIAPISAALGLEFISDGIYFIYSYTCHQFHWRSIHIFDYQVAWCVRDTFTWGGIFLTSLMIPRFQFKSLKFYLLLIFILPYALDGGIQTIATVLGLASGDYFYISTNLTRALTGAFFGIGIGMFVGPMMYEMVEIKYRDYNKRFYLKFVGIIIVLLLSIYISLVQVWNITSPKYPPSNFLDAAVREPEDDEWIRQKNGTCNPDRPKNARSGASYKDIIFLPQDCF